jgi:hypothetical protein
MKNRIRLLDDAVSVVLTGELESLKTRLGTHFVNIYWVRGKGKGGSNVLRCDITPNYFKEESK